MGINIHLPLNPSVSIISFNIIHRYTVDEDTLATTASLLKLDVCRKLVDFDNHLDNLKFDWRNPEINDMLSRCM